MLNHSQIKFPANSYSDHRNTSRITIIYIFSIHTAQDIFFPTQSTIFDEDIPKHTPKAIYAHVLSIYTFHDGKYTSFNKLFQYEWINKKKYQFKEAIVSNADTYIYINCIYTYTQHQKHIRIYGDTLRIAEKTLRKSSFEYAMASSRQYYILFIYLTRINLA